MPTNKKKIVLVDDHIVVRTALKELIQKLGPYNVYKEIDNGAALLTALPLLSAIQLIILDISMPALDGMETLFKLKENENTIPILILTNNDDDSQAIKVFRLGARGYLRKNCTALELKEAIDKILTSGYYHNKYFAHSIQNEQGLNENINVRNVSTRDQILAKLNEKEKAFLKLVCHEDEYTYQMIAEKMQLSLRAIDKCRENLFEKFNIKSKAGLVIFAFRFDLYNHL